MNAAGSPQTQFRDCPKIRPKPQKPGNYKWPAHFSGALGIFLAFGYLVSPRPSERDGLSNSERRSVDLGTFYLNSSVLANNTEPTIY